MKKVLSLVLAVMMVVGMSTTAFAALTAATTATGIAGAIDTTVGVSFDIPVVGLDNKTAIGSGTTITTIDASTHADLKALLAGGSVKFVADGGNAGAADKGVLTVTFGVATTTPLAADTRNLVLKDATHTLTIPFTGAITVAAEEEEDLDGVVPTQWKITGFSDDAAKLWDGTVIPSVVAADQEYTLPITADMFKWEGKNKAKGVPGEDFAEKATVRSSQLKDIGVRRVYQKGTNGTIRDVELRDSKSNVRVRTVQFYTKTKSTDVELKIALTHKGSIKGAPEAEFNFSIENDKETIEEGMTECYSFGNVYLEAEATVRNIEFQGDDDEIVFATKTVVKGQKYYFNATTELSSDDEKIIADNPEVDSIYNIYQTNMANATVQFKDLDREFFVYDGEGKLLGTTKDKKLPLAAKYILTTAKVDFGGADEEPVEEPTVEEPADVDAPPMGGGEVPPSNNYNPNTGL